jgi:hypothetical protein
MVVAAASPLRALPCSRSRRVSNLIPPTASLHGKVKTAVGGVASGVATRLATSSSLTFAIDIQTSILLLDVMMKILFSVR